tara:strand:+ start:7847 stop:8035 length:189 start_codon:yes stop_codon:yes gene_type:complete
MEELTYLTVAYLGMIFGLAVWTWTVVSRSQNLESRIQALEESLELKEFDKDLITSKFSQEEE